MTSKIVGLDIGSDSVRAVELADPFKPRPTLVRYHQAALPPGAVVRGEVVEQNTVAETLKRVWKAGGFTSRRVVLGVGNQKVFARELTVPRAPLVNIRESLPFVVQDMLPVPVSDALLDFYPIAEVHGEGAPAVRGLLIAVIKEAVIPNVTAARLAGLTVEDVDLLPFALTRLLLPRPGSRAEASEPGGAVLIDVGANTTSVVMTEDGVPQFVRLIPAGGVDVTRSVQEGLELDVPTADAVKRRIGVRAVQSAEDRPALELIQRPTGELLNSLRNTVSFFTNTRPEQAIRRIVLTGGGGLLPGFSESLARLTGIPVTAGDPLAAVTLAPRLAADDVRRDSHSLSAALGLAMGAAA